jgi:hypothetical protein
MPTGRYSIAEVTGLKISARRALVFLVCNGECDARAAFDKLVPSHARLVRERFDHWIDGGIHTKYHHGWDEAEYRQCYCFRWKDGRVNQRLYGFKCNPNRDDTRFQLSVLVFYATKAENTDFTILDRINRLRSDPNVLAAIRRYLEGK